MTPSRRAFGSGVATGVVLGLALAAVAVGLWAWLIDDEPADPIAEARETIAESYYEDVDSQALDRASIEGMVRELRRSFDDRFSHYFTEGQLRRFNQSTSGRFAGVGLTVSEVPQGLRVATVIPDAPAEAAGIREGDLITAVDGDSIAGQSADVSAAQIKGPPGTEVDLRVKPRSGRPREITIERASVRFPAVRGELRTVDGRKVAYVRFATFSRGAHAELRDTIERLDRRGAEALVLDLRGNGGGLLNEAILSTSVFVEDGPVVSTDSRTRGERTFDAVGDALAPRPMAVLVNRDTASASEILAAALKVNELATVVGTRTFGKATVQEVIPLEAGGALDLTIGEYLTADGKSILGEGVKPQVRVEDDPDTDADEARRRALEVAAGTR